MSPFRNLTFLLAVFLLFLSTGCSVFVGGYQELTIVTTESNADIYVNGQLNGRGTATVVVPRNRGVSIMVQAPGYQTATETVGYTMSATGLADFAGALICIVPGIGLLAPGAQTLTLDTVTIPLNPVGTNAEPEEDDDQ